jgi:hypothetical protein
VNSLLVALSLLTPCQPPSPTVGEEVRDHQGRLLRRFIRGQDAEPRAQAAPQALPQVGDDGVESHAFLIWIWNRRNPDRQQAPADPAVLRALEELSRNQQRLTELMARLEARNAQPPPPAAPQIILLNPYQQLQPEPKPRQDLPVEPKPRQDLPVEPKPRQDLPVDPKPRQDLPLEPRPRQDLNPDGTPRQDLRLAPGGVKPYQEPPGIGKPPLAYREYTATPAVLIRGR